MKTKAILFFSAAALFLVFIPSITKAQFSKGDLLVEGGLGNIDVSKDKSQYESNGTVGYKYENKGFSIAILPRVGFFLSNDFVVGTTLGINFSSGKSKNLSTTTGQTLSDSKSSATVLDVLPFVRYYFPGNAKTRFYIQGDGGISVNLSQKNEGKYYDNFGMVTNTYKTDYDKKRFGYSAEGLVGVNHFVSQNVAVNAALGGNYSKSTVTSSTNYTPGGALQTPEKYTLKTTSFVWNVGFTMIIPCTKKKK